MANASATAEKWTRFLASRPYVPKAPLILTHFAHGRITRLCDCGCNSYELAVSSDAHLQPLVQPSTRGGCALALAFYTSEEADPRRTVEINVHVDAHGFLAGLDVDYCANSATMPEDPQLLEPPFHLHGQLLDGI